MDPDMRTEDFSAIDMSVLETLQGLDNTGAIRDQVIAVVIDDLTTHFNELREAADKGDDESVRKTAHGLKSSAGSVGASGLNLLLRDAEHAALDGDSATVRARIEFLGVVIPVVIASLRAMLEADTGQA